MPTPTARSLHNAVMCRYHNSIHTNAAPRHSYSLVPNLSYAYVVCTYRGGKRTAEGFDSLTLAKRHADLNAPAFVYRSAQVKRVAQGTCYLDAANKDPIYVGQKG